eukprot:TRINITY_DN15601_c0_g1_i1.p1 TRINITY_DN15601_c0_g1~~TRINITY_DN15601_c0_g1_i1.p1  ORF type:complete len:512 (+),score=90.07 TRINITY_DN15601_c0_g1_i1:51-1538(+)
MRAHTILLLCIVAQAHTAQLPNLVIALVDDLGRYNVPWYNPNQTKAEGLNKLATEEGAILDRFYTFRVCSPTRSSLLSGRFPIHVNEENPVGVGVPGGIDIKMTLLPQKLKKVGYKTAMVGKWHCGARSDANLPINRGFDHHLGFLTGGEDHFTQIAGSTSPYVDLWLNTKPAIGRNGTYSCYLYGDEAVNVIENHDTTSPLFLYIPFHDTHAPYEAVPKYEDPTIPNETIKIMQAMVSCVADATVNITDALKRKNMWDNTLFVWASDNGGPQYWSANNYPLRGGKTTDFEGGVRVAAFVTGGLLDPSLRGTTITSAMHLVDLHTTMCKLSGQSDEQCGDEIPGYPSTDGMDLRGYFVAPLNMTRPVKDIVLSSNAFISGDWKYVASTVNASYCQHGDCGYWTGPWWPITSAHVPLEADPGCPVDGCLFNLADDVTEHHELSTQYPERQQAMKAQLAKYVEGRFQTNSTYGYNNCTTLKEAASKNGGFAAPLCTL